MAASAPPSYDFAFSTGLVNAPGLGELLFDLQRDFPKDVVGMDLYGRVQAGEVLALVRFNNPPFSLSWKLRRDGERINGRFFEFSRMSDEDKAWFAGQLGEAEFHRPVGPDARLEMQSLLAQVGGADPRASELSVTYDSEQTLAAAYAHFVTAGALFVPTDVPIAAGSEITLRMVVKARLTPFVSTAKVLEPATEDGHAGVYVALSVQSALKDFLTDLSLEQRQGRVQGLAGGNRKFARYDTCLEVRSLDGPELGTAMAVNISRGGLFVRTLKPPEMRAEFTLELQLPAGLAIQCAVEVTRVVGGLEAQRRGTTPGFGLKFLRETAEFVNPLEELLHKYEDRVPRLLLVDDDAFFRKVLSQALHEAGMAVTTASGADEAMAELVKGFFQLDLLLLDLNMPGVDGRSLIDRIRKLGEASDMRIVLLSGEAQTKLDTLRGPGGADDVIHKGTDVEEIVRRVDAVVNKVFLARL